MAPTLAPDDWALVVVPKRFALGDVVVVEHPGRPGFEMVKRIAAVPGARVGDRTLAEDEFWVEGDMGAASTDSRQFGPVSGEALKAKVLLVYWPRERRRTRPESCEDSRTGAVSDSWKRSPRRMSSTKASECPKSSSRAGETRSTCSWSLSMA